MATTAVVTGATAGIGRVAVDEMLRQDPGLHLVLLGRRAPVPLTMHPMPVLGDRVRHVQADLADLDSVLRAAAEIRGLLACGALPQLATVVGNAGVSVADATHASAQGFELTFAVNVLAHHALIADLVPELDRRGSVVLTVSDTHFGDLRHGLGMPAPRWTSPVDIAMPGTGSAAASGRAGRVRYTTSKLAGVYLAHAWARRLPGSTVLAYNPGLVPRTGLARDLGPAARAVMRAARLLEHTPLASSPADAGAWLADAAQGRIAAPNGSYLNRSTVEPSSPESYDPRRESELWEFLEAVIDRRRELG